MHVCHLLLLSSVHWYSIYLRLAVADDTRMPVTDMVLSSSCAFQSELMALSVPSMNHKLLARKLACSRRPTTACIVNSANADAAACSRGIIISVPPVEGIVYCICGGC
ncbi:hypothetical protein ZWY2020_003613 [Hordeum vulgare]|nr:hypothetical protein ZWY2020_003613 [Hordeum vulgare]